ncbi:hypothetical protein D3C74_01800 [compost metagenome]
MTQFIHLAPEDTISAIRRTGIRKSRIHYPEASSGVFCMPVIDDYYAVHQWLRELKRFNKKNLKAVHFRVRDQEQVYFGSFSGKHRYGTAAAAAGQFRQAEDRMGFQVIIPRSIAAAEIITVRSVSQVTGWRYSPSSKGRPPCLCPACFWTGHYDANRLVMHKFKQMLTLLREPEPHTQIHALQEISELRFNHPGRIKDFEPLLHLLRSPDLEIVIHCLDALAQFKNNTAWQVLMDHLHHPSQQVQLAAAQQLLYWRTNQAQKLLKPKQEDIPGLDKLLLQYEEDIEA